MSLRKESVLIVITAIVTFAGSYFLLRPTVQYEIRKEIIKKKIDVYLELSAAVDDLYPRCRDLAVKKRNKMKIRALANACSDLRTKIEKNRLIISEAVYKRIIEEYIPLVVSTEGVNQDICNELKLKRNEIYYNMRKEFNIEELEKMHL